MLLVLPANSAYFLKEFLSTHFIMPLFTSRLRHVHTEANVVVVLVFVKTLMAKTCSCE